MKIEIQKVYTITDVAEGYEVRYCGKLIATCLTLDLALAVAQG